MVTAGTYQKLPLFRSAARLAFLCDSLLSLASRYGWNLEAWAVFPNHYHFVASSPKNAAGLRTFISHFHTLTAKEINRKDRTPGRKVWFQYWDTRLTYERSYLARLNYVHCNAVRHGLVPEQAQCPWCSAGWFERRADKSFYRTVMSFRSDRITAPDDFAVDPADVV
jgi:putative transposase